MKKLSDDELSDLLRSKLDVGVEPPITAWQGIETGMPQVTTGLVEMVGVGKVVMGLSLATVVSGWLYVSNIFEKEHPITKDEKNVIEHEPKIQLQLSQPLDENSQTISSGEQNTKPSQSGFNNLKKTVIMMHSENEKDEQPNQNNIIDKLSAKRFESFLKIKRRSLANTRARRSAVLRGKAKNGLLSKLDLYVDLQTFLMFYKIDPLRNDNIYIDNIHTSSDNLFERIGLKPSIGLKYKLMDKLKVKAEVSYFKSRRNVTYDGVLTRENEGQVEVYGTFSERKQISINSISIGLGAEFLLLRNKENDLIGVQYDRLISAGQDNPFLIDQNVDFLSLYYAKLFRIQKEFKVKIQPMVNYSFSTKALNAPFELDPFRYGMSVGLYYSRKLKQNSPKGYKGLLF